MIRSWLLVVLLWLGFSTVCTACSCISFERACEYLHNDVVFVGRVEETSAVKHPMDKNSWTHGYSMRFAVEESLRGVLGAEVTIETGSGGGDCGTPLPPGRRFLIFAYKHEDGKLWTGLCSGNRELGSNPNDSEILQEYRRLVKSGVGSIFGRVGHARPGWRDDDIEDFASGPFRGMVLHADSDQFHTTTKTAKDGTYEFNELPPGKYTVTPEVSRSLNFDREYFEERYQADLSPGRCKNISFKLYPSTRIRGHLSLPVGLKDRSIEVVAIPTSLRNLNQFSGKWDFTDENESFDLWPLPPGDYYVGVNINSSPKPDSPFPPTYYPGVTSQRAAKVVHVDEGQIVELELPVREIAKPRTVNFVAVGLDGKPMRKIYVQLEDLRHPGDAFSYTNVDLDSDGAGSLIVYAGYSYHLHGSRFVSYGKEWCTKPVTIPAGTEPLEVKFVVDRVASSCRIQEIDERNQ